MSRTCLKVLLVVLLTAASHLSFALVREHIEHDVAYRTTNLPQHQLDLYFPPEAKAPLKPVIMIHGGCFSGGDKFNEVNNARRLVNSNSRFVAVVPNYTLAVPGISGSYPDAFQDLLHVVEWLHGPDAKRFAIDPSWIAAFGESAGGTLAAYLGTRPRLSEPNGKRAAVDVVLDFYGRTDFTRPQPQGRGVDCAADFLHATREQNPQLFRDASVSVSKGVKPARFLLVHGVQDKQVEIYHSENLRRILYRAGMRGADSQLISLGDAGHGYDDRLPLSESWRSAWHAALQFLHLHSQGGR